MTLTANISDRLITELPCQEQLPDSFAIWVEDLCSITITGEESQSYLQGQVTCDVNQVDEKGLLIGSHCDAKGKVFSVFRLYKHQQTLHLLQHKDSVEKSLAELKKFGVFAKVDISQSNANYLCLSGPESETWLKKHFTQLPDELTPVITHDSMTLLYLAGKQTRYLVVDHVNQMSDLINDLSLPLYRTPVWNLLEIIEGFPLLANSNIQKFVPQMLNVDAINGISFTKGCYLGQETVARMQYLGKNKKNMIALTGKIKQLTDISIEKQVGDNWRRGGDITTSYISENDTCYLQAIVAKDDAPNQYRLATDQLSLAQITLPYSLNESDQE